jgi:hypothetical protein
MWESEDKVDGAGGVSVCRAVLKLYNVDVDMLENESMVARVVLVEGEARNLCGGVEARIELEVGISSVEGVAESDGDGADVAFEIGIHPALHGEIIGWSRLEVWKTIVGICDGSVCDAITGVLEGSAPSRVHVVQM